MGITLMTEYDNTRTYRLFRGNKMKLPSNLPAAAMIELSGIPRRTFFDRVIRKNILYIQVFRGEKLYDIKDWNKKCSDYPIIKSE